MERQTKELTEPPSAVTDGGATYSQRQIREEGFDDGLLPDLDTQKISFISFVNAFNVGLPSEDGVENPEMEYDTALANSQIQNPEEYVNGFDAEYVPAVGDPIRVRVKSSGWFIAWVNRTEIEEANTDTPPAGPWDIMDWSDPTITADLVQNRLERAIADLIGGYNTNYTAGDTDMYDFRSPEAVGVTLLSSQSGSADGVGTLGFSRNQKLEVLSAQFLVSSDASTGDVVFDGAQDDVELFDATEGSYSSVEPELDEQAPEPFEEYEVTVDLGGNASVHLLTVWDARS